MKKIWLLFLLLLASTAYADNEIEPGVVARTSLPYPVRYPVDTTKPPGASLAIGNGALQKQYLPAGYENLAIGLNALNGTLSALGVQNVALGYNACSKVTDGQQLVCIGANAGKNITTSFTDILIGSGAGSGMTTSANGDYMIIMDASNPTVPCTTCTTSIFMGSGTGAINATSSTIVGYHAGLNDTHGGTNQTLIGANVGLNNIGSVGTQGNIILIGGNDTTGIILDTATTSTTGAIGIGTGYPGTGDTMIGYAALGSNTVDSAFQTAFGYHSLTLSNVAAAHNSAFGYQSCAAVTTGTDNVCFGYNSGATTLATGSSNILIGSGTDTVASSTSNEINIGGLLFYNNNSTAAPAVACNAGSPTIDSKANNKSGTMTAGAAATSCTITFAGTGYASWNHCRVAGQSASVGYSYTKTVITVTGTLGGVLVDYDCDGV